jgi:hypothetical protein
MDRHYPKWIVSVKNSGRLKQYGLTRPTPRKVLLEKNSKKRIKEFGKEFEKLIKNKLQLFDI